MLTPGGRLSGSSSSKLQQIQRNYGENRFSRQKSHGKKLISRQQPHLAAKSLFSPQNVRDSSTAHTAVEVMRRRIQRALARKKLLRNTPGTRKNAPSNCALIPTTMLRPNTQQSAIRHDGARSVGPKKCALESPPACVAQVVGDCKPTSLRLRSKMSLLRFSISRPPQWEEIGSNEQ